MAASTIAARTDAVKAMVAEGWTPRVLPNGQINGVYATESGLEMSVTFAAAATREGTKLTLAEPATFDVEDELAFWLEMYDEGDEPIDEDGLREEIQAMADSIDRLTGEGPLRPQPAAVHHHHVPGTLREACAKVASEWDFANLLA